MGPKRVKGTIDTEVFGHEKAGQQGVAIVVENTRGGGSGKSGHLRRKEDVK